MGKCGKNAGERNAQKEKASLREETGLFRRKERRDASF